VPDQRGLSGRARAALVVGAIAIIVVAFVLIQGASSDDHKDAATSTPAPTSSPATSSVPSGTTTQSTSTGEAPAPEPSVPTVRVVDAKPEGGVQKLEFDKGDQVRFRVVSDTADEIHVHGYDLAKDVPEGGSVAFSFKGSIDGRFEVELESRGEQIAELRVNP
jgi:hypothetical protein